MIDDICPDGSQMEPDESIPKRAGRIAFERLNLTPEDVLLDVGTGAGQHAIAAARICRRVIGIDIDRSRLEQARAKAVQERCDNVIFFDDPSKH